MEVEDRRCQRGLRASTFGTIVEGRGKIVGVAASPGRNHGDRYRGGNRAQERDVVALFGSIAIHTRQQDFAGTSGGHLLRPGDDDLALVFGRSLDAIRDKANDLCIAKDKAFLRKNSGGKRATRMPRWTEEELDLLRDWYPSHSNLDIAHKLARSVKSVVSKAHNMGLRKDPSRLREMGRENVSLRYGKRESR